METGTDVKTYELMLNASNELILDIDDLGGIIQQLEAISMGLGMDFSVGMLEEQEIYIWKNPQTRTG